MKKTQAKFLLLKHVEALLGTRFFVSLILINGDIMGQKVIFKCILNMYCPFAFVMIKIRDVLNNK